MPLRDIRRLCRARLNELDLPTHATPQALADIVAAGQDRPILLLPNGTDEGPCGVWIRTDLRDYVFVDASARGIYRTHIVAHELSHVLLDHGGTKSLPDVVAQQLAPEVDLTAIRKMLGRSSYTSHEEREAEVMASLILQRTQLLEGDHIEAEPGSEEAARLSAVLGSRRRLDA